MLVGGRGPSRALLGSTRHKSLQPLLHPHLAHTGQYSQVIQRCASSIDASKEIIMRLVVHRPKASRISTYLYSPRLAGFAEKCYIIGAHCPFRTVSAMNS